MTRIGASITAKGSRAIAGAFLAAVTVLAGASSAQAAPGDPFTPHPNFWCPGYFPPLGFINIGWDATLCHTWYAVPFGQGNIPVYDLFGNPMESPIYADAPQPTITPAPLPF